MIASSMIIQLFVPTVFAIQVDVKTSNPFVFALGYTVNGKRFGGLGHSYSNNHVPAGIYQFGVKAGGDIPCLTDKGEHAVRLNHDTSANLKVQGKKCYLEFVSK